MLPDFIWRIHMKHKKNIAIAMCIVATMFSTNAESISAENMESYGYIQSNLDGNTPVHVPDTYYDSGLAKYSDNETVPSAYQNDIQEVKKKYPETRNQNPYGTCWSFASMGLAEFDLINDQAADKNIDLSELQLAYFTYNFVEDPLGGTSGDMAKYYNENTSTSFLERGGNFEYATRRLSQWVGAIDESDLPYSKAYDAVTTGFDSSYAYSYDKVHLENTYEINIEKNTDDVKRAIMKNGAVGAMYMHHDNHIVNLVWNDNLNCYTYYDTDKSGSGHAIMIVGWDDDFSKDNFEGTIKPENDGAWLIRNSWGAYCDYFWMSYDTKSIVNTAWVMDFNSKDGYDNNYQLDGGIEVYPSYYKTLANVFQCNSKDGVAYETLKAVSLSMTSSADVEYQIDVYTNLTDSRNPYSGIKQENATTKGKTTFAGIYNIKLNDSVTIMPGTNFAIVVTVDKAAIDQEQATSWNSGNKTVWERKVSKNTENSLVLYNGKFYTQPNGNYCIKAFTSNNTTQVIKGDLNNDGKIGINDLNRCVQGVSGRIELTEQEYLSADIDGNGKVDIRDAMRLLYYVSGRNANL